jgi:hypothetical protein
MNFSIGRQGLWRVLRTSCISSNRARSCADVLAHNIMLQYKYRCAANCTSVTYLLPLEHGPIAVQEAELASGIMEMEPSWSP